MTKEDVENKVIKKELIEGYNKKDLIKEKYKKKKNEKIKKEKKEKNNQTGQIVSEYRKKKNGEVLFEGVDLER